MKTLEYYVKIYWLLFKSLRIHHSQPCSYWMLHTQCICRSIIK